MPYIRKYSGPLQPGRRSAYVKGSRRNASGAGRPRNYRRNGYVSKKKQTFRKKVPTKAFTSQMKKYERKFFEKKIIPYKNYTIGQGAYQLNQINPVALINYGPTGNTDSIVSCIIVQTGDTLTDNNTNLNSHVADLCTAIGGYSMDQGETSDEIIGSYARISSSKINWNIQMVPQSLANGGPHYKETLADMLPHQFRFIQVKRKSTSVAPGAESLPSALTPNLANGLFIDERGVDVGLTDPGAAQDCWTHFINKKKWIVLCDKRFTLANACAQNSDINQTNLTPAFMTGIAKHPSQKFMSTYMPRVNRRIKWGYNPVAPTVGPQQPTDYNYVVHTIILCKSQGLYGTGRNWQLEVNGTTSIIDV